MGGDFEKPDSEDDAPLPMPTIERLNEIANISEDDSTLDIGTGIPSHEDGRHLTIEKEGGDLKATWDTEQGEWTWQIQNMS